jgi:hypothetical protein
MSVRPVRPVRSRPLAVAACALALLATTAARPAAAAELRATYLFNNTLAAEEGGAPALGNVNPLGLNHFTTSNVFGQNRTVFDYQGNADPPSQQAGLSLNTTGLIPANNYSMEMVFKFRENPNAWRRILEVQGRVSDDGFYVDPSNNLNVYPTSGVGSTAFLNDKFHHVVLTDSGGIVNGYLDGRLEFTVATNVMDIANPGNVVNFFLDNDVPPFTDEYSSGQVALIRAWEGALTADEVANLAANPFPAPEPSTLTLAGVGALGLLGYACRRRRQARAVVDIAGEGPVALP